MIERTQTLLVTCKRWNEETRDLPLLGLINVGPIRMDQWDSRTHSDVRAWAKELKDMPEVIRTYLDRVRAAK